MDFEQELKKFELSSVFTINFSWLMRYVESDSGMYTPIKSISADEFREIESSFYALQAAWKAWREAKAQAVPETQQALNDRLLVKSIREHVESHIAEVSVNDLFDKGWLAAMKCIQNNIDMLEAQEPVND